ncbi:MAG: hypothetical protein H5T62_18185 [Anaerolineae bacterium]|nr:hypothetical protein [Anaerolineae bacterium]
MSKKQTQITRVLETLFVAAAGLGMLFVGWAAFLERAPQPSPTPTATATAVAAATSSPTPTSTPTASPSPTSEPSAFELTILHTNDTWGYVYPCG